MSRRKTIEISEMVEKANYIFKNSANEAHESRAAIKSFVTDLLLSNGVYDGFNYLREKDVAPGYTFGIIFDESEARNHVYPDDTRVHLYFK